MPPAAMRVSEVSSAAAIRRGPDAAGGHRAAPVGDGARSYHDAELRRAYCHNRDRSREHHSNSKFRALLRVMVTARRLPWKCQDGRPRLSRFGGGVLGFAGMTCAVERGTVSRVAGRVRLVSVGTAAGPTVVPVGPAPGSSIPTVASGRTGAASSSHESSPQPRAPAGGGARLRFGRAAPRTTSGRSAPAERRDGIWVGCQSRRAAHRAGWRCCQGRGIGWRDRRCRGRGLVGRELGRPERRPGG
jgi:hypothetical protein